MNNSHRPESPDGLRWDQADFEFAALLKCSTDAGEAPAALLRRVPWQRSVWAPVAAALPLALAVWGLVAWIVPPQVVRDAMVHEHREATLRGDFQPDKSALLTALGMPPGTTLPGLVQLQRPCDIAGRSAFHVTTFMEKGGGMVTMLAFDKVLPELHPGETGRWMGRYWRVSTGASGRTVLLLADNAQVLAETEAFLHRG